MEVKTTESGTAAVDLPAGTAVPPIAAGDAASSTAEASVSPLGADTVDSLPAVGDEGQPEGLGTPAAPSPVKDWKDARIAKITAKNKALQEQLERLGKQQTGPVAGLDEAEVERRANEKATTLAGQMTAQAAWDAKCVATAEQGRKDFVDFDQRLGDLRSVVDETDPVEAKAYLTLVEIAMETGEGAKVIHALGSNPAEVSRVLALSPAKMAIELAKMAFSGKQAGPAAASVAALEVSAAPKPLIVPGRGAPVNQIDPTDAARSDKLSTKEWMTRRNEQAAERAKLLDRRVRA